MNNKTNDCDNKYQFFTTFFGFIGQQFIKKQLKKTIQHN